MSAFVAEQKENMAACCPDDSKSFGGVENLRSVTRHSFAEVS